MRKIERDFSSCLKFNNPNYVSLAQTSGLPVMSSVSASWSISLWFNEMTYNASGHALYAEGRSTVSNPFFAIMAIKLGSVNQIRLQCRNDSNSMLINAILTATEIPLGRWTHVCATNSAGTVHVYVNGVEDANSVAGLFDYTPSGTITVNTSSIGALTRTSTSNYFDGFVDEVVLFNRAITSSEVESLASFYPPPTSGLVGYYKFDENTGSSVADSSGNGNTGTINGTPAWSSSVVSKPRTVAASRTAAGSRTAAS